MVGMQRPLQPVKEEDPTMAPATEVDLKYVPCTPMSLPPHDLNSSSFSRLMPPEEVAQLQSQERQPRTSSTTSSTVLSLDPRPAYQVPSSRSQSHILCPNLVVPVGMEFVCVVPEALQTHAQNTTFTTSDLDGKELMRVVVQEGRDMLQCGIRLEFMDGRQLAFLNTAAIYQDRHADIKVFRPTGEMLCSLSREEALPNGKYTAHASVSGEKLLAFGGDFGRKTVRVVNETGRIVCATERCAVSGEGRPNYQVRVAPGGDAGLLLCGLLGIDKMEGATGYETQ